MCVIGGYWNYTFSKIEIIQSDILDYDVVKIYFSNGKLAEEYETKDGIKSLYKCILEQYVALEKRKIPEIEIINIKTTITKRILEI